eukprot:TRINITY_DN5979_c0_g1_i1.p1 TRINITY_DN5979_c0_g1~~TRINITY_DN5979_c0_g1_i1.p1  ORF type:complete len:796 (-),score=101.45 TRINITY_DN5979_c0_g1_i1:267-2654(-)
MGIEKKKFLCICQFLTCYQKHTFFAESLAMLPTTMPPAQQRQADKQTPSTTTQDYLVSQLGQRVFSMTSTTLLPKQALLNNSGFPFGAIINPQFDNQSQIPILVKPAIYCMNCGAFYDRFTPLSGTSNSIWRCKYCGQPHGMEHPDSRPGVTPESVERSWDIFQYVTPEVVSEVWKAETIVFAIDQTMDQDQLDIVGSAMSQALEQIEQFKNVIFLTFGGCVSVYYNLGKGSSVIESVMLPGDGELDMKQFKKVIEAKQVCLPVSVCLQKAQIAMKNIKTYQQSVTERHRARCLGRAIDIAITLAHMNTDGSTGTSRVVVLASGPSTKGPGTLPLEMIDDGSNAQNAGDVEDAIQYFQRLAEDAEMYNVTVDVFSGGLAAVNVPLMENLVRSSGGAFCLTEGFGPLLAQNLVAAIGRVQGKDGIIDIYTSSGVDVVRLVGPVIELTEEERQDLSPGQRPPSQNAYFLSTVELGQGISVEFEAKRDFKVGEKIYFQVVVGWHRPDGRTSYQVASREITVTDSVTQYLGSIQSKVIGVLAAKFWVIECTRQSKKAKTLEDIRNGIGASAQLFATRFGQKVIQKGGLFGWATRTLHQWPKEQGPLLWMMYNLQRGVLLGNLLGHKDQRMVLSSHFVQADADICYSYMVPMLYNMDLQQRSLMPLPAVDLALNPQKVLVLENGSILVVWIGRLAQYEQSAIDEMVQQMVRIFGFPQPEYKQTRQGEGDQRYILARLAPLYPDSQETRVQQFPEFLKFDRQAQQMIAAEMMPTEELSFQQWCKQFNIIPTNQSLSNYVKC